MSKKIAVGINIFKESFRQSLCIESLIKCKQSLPDTIDLYNLQFFDGRDLTEHKDFKTLKCLKKTSTELCNGTRGLPITKEMFDCLAELGYEYFCFINSDIIVSLNFFKEILDNPGHDAYIASRLAIEGNNIKDLNFEIKLNDPTSHIKNSHYQVSGFDCYTINSKWWKTNRHLFPEYVYAVIYWDTHYATLLLKNGNTYMQNKKPTIFHIIHGDDSSAQCPELLHNQNTFYHNHREDFDRWHRYFFGVLVKRGEDKNFLYPFANEVELEKIYFKQI
jgi:hypothetical protein